MTASNRASVESPADPTSSSSASSAELEIKHRFWHVRNQYLAVICVNLITVSHGMAIGWISPAFLTLTGPDTPLNDGPLSTDYISWIGAVNNVGGLFGNFFYSWVTKRYGRKVAVCLLAVPNIIWWISVFFVRDAVWLIPLRIIAGLSGGGAFICVPLFVAEIASDRVRGSLGSILTLSLNVGILIAYVTGAFLPYHIVPAVLIVVPIVFFVSALFLPETPQYLITHGRPEEAEKSLRFYRGCGGDSAEDRQRFDSELVKLKAHAKRKENEEESRIVWADFWNPAARRGLLIGVIMMSLNIFTGGLLMLNYAGTIFKESGSDLDPNTSAIILISVQLVGTYIASFLVDRIGRRALLIASTIGSGTGMFLMATYSYLNYLELDLGDFNWVPVASLSLSVFMASMGLLPLAFVVLAEVLPIKIREIGSTYCLALISLFLLLCSKFYPVLAETIGMYSCFWFFSGVCMFGLLFAIFILPETNGKNINNL